MDNILGTILDIKGKTKDNYQARQDLQEMGLRPKLHPYTGNDGKMYLPPARHTMLNEDKTAFLKVLRDVRVPDGYASNIFRCVRMKDRMMLGLKSHDNHLLMQQLLPIALRGLKLPSNVVKVLVDMSTFFKGICEMTLTPEALDKLQDHVCITLCLMEQTFPPAFSLARFALSSILSVNADSVDWCNIDGCTLERGKF